MHSMVRLPVDVLVRLLQVLRGNGMRRGSEGMFYVRFLDGTDREGWMFIPLHELGPGVPSSIDDRASGAGPRVGCATLQRFDAVTGALSAGHLAHR